MDGRSKEIDVKILQQAFRDSGMSRTEVARGMGWYKNKKNRLLDGTRVGRALGLDNYQQKQRATSKMRYYKLSTTNYERAVELVIAMGLEPTDYGL